MITVNIKKFVDAIKEADVYRLPDMNEGTGYLYNSLYKRLARCEDVKLSSLDFDAFEQEDINTLNNLHSDVFVRDCSRANGVIHTLHNIVPACKAVTFV